VKRDRFAILSKANTIMINDIETNEVTKAITPPYPIDDLFSAHTDTLILRSEDKLTLYDVQQERIINVLKLPHVKFVIRSGSSKDSMMAVICRGAVVRP
jgi:coatomer protein complex subunit alpha (xenin)